MSMYAEASKPLDGLTHTKLCFAPDTPESNISAMLRALHKVPGVLLADAPPGFCCAAIAHDGGVPVAELLKAVSSAGVTATVAPIPLPSIESAPIDNGQRKIFAVFGAFVLTLVLINLRSIFGKIDGSQLILMISLLPLAFCLSFVLEKIVTTSGRKLSDSVMSIGLPRPIVMRHVIKPDRVPTSPEDSPLTLMNLIRKYDFIIFMSRA